MTKSGKNKERASVDPAEVARFSALAKTWWDVSGPFKPLHRMNPIRLRYIEERISEHFALKGAKEKPFKGLALLDIGCGGGLLSEPMARCGATVTGLDASEENIAVAKLHAKESGLAITYRAATAEELAAAGKTFDIILNMEVVEHVADVESYLTACRTLLKKDGLMIFSTIARTPKAFLLTIVGAEYVLRWLPRGTHDYKKFLKPSELAEKLTHCGFQLDDLTGFVFDPLSGSWSMQDDVSVNYAGVAVARKN